MLENLPNELFLDLFKYFDSISLIYAFCGLNSRFNNLLFIYLQSHSLDFQSVSKHQFDTISQQHIRSLANQIISLHLSNHDETPNIAQYFSRAFTLKQFNHLQSLSLCNINSSHILNRIIYQCHDLLYFTHLYITKCRFSWEDNCAFRLINNIWRLSKLSHLKLNLLLFDSLRFTDIQVISLSIEHLSINTYNWNFFDLSHLFENTPHLRHLSTINITQPCRKYLRNVVTFISELKLSLTRSFITTPISFHSITKLFSKMPNLSYLTIKTTGINLDGNDWKNILIRSLPNIKLFQLNMNFSFNFQIDTEEQVDQLLDSFRTPFWVEEHNWFVCCDWYPSDTNKDGFLYTLPYAFDNYVYNHQICSKTTRSNPSDHSFYNSVNTLKVTTLKKDSILDFNVLSRKFPNIHHLDLHLSFNNNIASIILSFNHLTSLKISALPSFDCSLLQMLLDRAPLLYSLSLYQVLFQKSMIYKLKSKSIRRIELISVSTTDYGYLNTVECSTLSNSSLGQQCEFLKLGVKNRSDILQIVKTMFHLRSLTVQCEDDITGCCRSILSTHGDLIKWLQHRLPSIYSITRDENHTDTIRLWIH